MLKTAFLVNPKVSGSQKLIKKLEEEYSQHDFKIFISEYPGHLFKLPSELINQSYNCFIAVGGDGTLNEMLNGVLYTFKAGETINWEEASKIYLGVYPAGSGNDFARNIYSPGNVNLKELIENKEFKLVDLGCANFLDKNKEATSRYFINITDIGIGGVVAHTKSKLPFFIPSGLKYFLSILYGFITYKKREVAISGNKYNYSGKVLSFTIANGKFFGKGIGIAPHAEIDDGKLAITNIANVNLLDYALNVNTAKKVKKIKHPEVSYDETGQITVSNITDEDIVIDMDGEFVGYTPIEITCLPLKIKFLSN